ncbi:MAG: hypothetical protein WCK90_00515 [archaeon]
MKGEMTLGSVPMANKRDRQRWLVQHIQKTGRADVLDVPFVDAYVDANHVAFRPCAWGANKCATLGRDLAALEKMGALKRFRIGLGGNWAPGFPRWVWSYEIGTNGHFLHASK